MSVETLASDTEQCPFLVPVMADRLWLHPVTAYCRRPGGRVRVPASRTTLPCICLTVAHLMCPGYLAAAAGDPATPGGRAPGPTPMEAPAGG